MYILPTLLAHISCCSSYYASIPQIVPKANFRAIRAILASSLAGERLPSIRVSVCLDFVYIQSESQARNLLCFWLNTPLNRPGFVMHHHGRVGGPNNIDQWKSNRYYQCRLYDNQILPHQ